MVDRYEPEFLEEYDWTPIRKDDDGDYVLYSDYEALEAKLAALVEAAEPVSQAILPSGDQMKKLKAAIAAARVTP